MSEAAPPLLVEVTRGAMVESRHRVAFAVVDVAGHVAMSGGEVERPIYARSAVKPLQALAVIETGAAEAFALGEAEIALACASHGAEPRHVETVRAWLARIGCSEADLECGPQLPANAEAAAALLRGGGAPAAVHNNCSGKHSGFLTVARHLGRSCAGYIAYEHPVQQRVLGILEQMTGLELGAAPRGVDGCGIPVIGIPLGNVALAMARLADPVDQPDARREACAHIRRAMAAEPFLVAGTGRFDTEAIAATGGEALTKAGAEGVHCAALPAYGLGVALKVADGAGRAAEAAMAHLLHAIGVADDDLARRLVAPVRNRAGREVGEVRVAPHPPH